MKTVPLVPAEIDFSDPLAPRAPAFDDVYHARQGAQAQARHVFLGGNELPSRWAGRDHFVILETGFGLGHNFLATWAAWQADPDRARRLCYISVEMHPPRAADLQRAHAGSPLPGQAQALCDAWPPLTPDLHRRLFDGGAVELLLLFGDAATALREVVATVDAFYLDGFAPARNPQMWSEGIWKALARLAAPTATAATWSAAAVVREGLASAGFEVTKAPGTGGKRDITIAHHAERVPMRRPAFRVGHAATQRVAIVGAGLAGAFAARALAAQGLQCTVIEAQAAPAMGASGNPAGLFHGVFHTQDGPHARALRAAALAAQALYREALAAGVPGEVRGLVRLDPESNDPAADAERLAASGLPADYLQAWSPAQAQTRGAAALPAWFFPGGGWIDPRALTRWALDVPGVSVVFGRRVARLVRQADAAGPDAPAGRWQLLDDADTPIADADAVVLASALDVPRLCAALEGSLAAGLHGDDATPLTATRGQVSWLAPGIAADRPDCPVAGAGYAIPLPDGGLLFGSTRHPGDFDISVRVDDHAHNLAQLALLTGREPPGTADALLARGVLEGRVGWRANTVDRLPWIGALPVAASALSAGRLPDQPRHWPRVPGVFVLAGLGSRGLTWGPLAGRLLASWITDEPFPVGARLVDALDPARCAARAVRAQAARAAAVDAEEAVDPTPDPDELSGPASGT